VLTHIARDRASWAEGRCEPEHYFVNGDKVIAHLRARARLRDTADWVGGHFANGFVLHGGRIALHLSFAERAEALDWAGIGQPDVAVGP
jgi:hypothetical protein